MAKIPRSLRRAMRFAGAAMVLLTLFAGCGGRHHVNTEYRDDGSAVVELVNHEIKVEGTRQYHVFGEGDYAVEKRLFLDLRRTTSPSGRVSYAFTLTYIGDDRLTIEKGRSLELVLDGRSYLFSGEGDVFREMDPSGKPFTERLDYPVERDFLIRLAGARSVDVVVTGHEGEIKGYFDPDNSETVRWFVREYVRDEPQTQ